jgi:signal transduction histidine kinase
MMKGVEIKSGKKGDSVINRLLRLFLSVGILTMLTITGLYLVMAYSYKMISASSELEFDKEAEAFVAVTTKLPDQIVWDYSYWDEFVSVLKSYSLPWYEENISTIISSFHMDYVCVYDSTFQLKHEVFAEGITQEKILPENLSLLFKNSPSVKFFTRTPSGIYKVSAASVHPSNDPTHDRTASSGYLFIGKYLGDSYLEELSILSGGDVTVTDTTNLPHVKRYYMSASVDLNSWDGKWVGNLVFIRKSEPLKLLQSGFTVTIVILVVIWFVVWRLMWRHVKRWVVSPIKNISLMIANEDMDSMRKLEGSPSEFLEVANLFKKHIDQKGELITAMKRAEESDRLKSAFLANISHEIRTPMNGILGFSELLKMEDITEEQRFKYLNIIGENGKKMISLLNNLIKISQLDSGQVVPVYSVFNLNELLDYAYVLYRNEVIEKGLDLIVEKKEETDNVNIVSDREMVYFVLVTLLKNAIRFTRAGSITFGLEKIENGILFYVKDTGIGIPENKKKVIFDIFVQADNSLTREFEGVGLGLSISKAYVELLGGRMWVESDEKKGSDFYFTINPKNITKQEI